MQVIQYKRDTKIAVPGIYIGVPMDVYHSDLCVEPSVSSSGLRAIEEDSPAHYFDQSYLNTERVEDDEEKEAFTLGRAAHHLLLGEDAFSTTFIVRPSKFDSWRSNDAKAWKRDQESEGRTVLLPGQISQIRGMARSLARHPMIEEGILNGLIEHSMVWKDKETGVWIKTRPDTIPNYSGDFADLKTIKSVKSKTIADTLAERGYHQQGALIGEGFEVLTGHKMTTFTLVFVEKKRPHCVRTITLTGADLDRGREQNRYALRTFARCLETNVWPGPGDQEDAEYMELPEWKQKQIDRRLDYRKRAQLDAAQAAKHGAAEYAATP